MDYRHQHAHIGDFHLEVWVADDWAHSRVENITTHEQLFVAKSKRFEAAKTAACAFAKIGDEVEWKPIG